LINMMVYNYLRYLTCKVADAKVTLLCRIQLGQPATVKVAANLIRLLAYQNKVCSIAFQHRLLKHSFTFLIDKHLVSEFDVKLLLNYKMNVCY